MSADKESIIPELKLPSEIFMNVQFYSFKNPKCQKKNPMDIKWTPYTWNVQKKRQETESLFLSAKYSSRPLFYDPQAKIQRKINSAQLLICENDPNEYKDLRTQK